MHRTNDWHYIHKEQNPADLSSITQTDFKSVQQKWFYGPEITHQKTYNIKEINIRNQYEEKLGINISLTTQ